MAPLHPVKVREAAQNVAKAAELEGLDVSSHRACSERPSPRLRCAPTQWLVPWVWDKRAGRCGRYCLHDGHCRQPGAAIAARQTKQGTCCERILRLGVKPGVPIVYLSRGESPDVKTRFLRLCGACRKGGAAWLGRGVLVLFMRAVGLLAAIRSSFSPRQ